jgi:hypothetical protein
MYNKLKDLSTPIKLKASRDNTEFGVAQVLDILFQNWFLVDLRLVLPNSKDKEEINDRPSHEI